MKIFVGAPFSNYLNGGSFDPALEKAIRSIINLLREKAFSVRSAHLREEFGRFLATPDVCTAFDWREVKECNIFLAIPGNPPSGGVHIELGWASSLKKKIVLCLEKGANYSPLVWGLVHLSDAKIVYFSDYQDLLLQLQTMFENGKENVVCEVSKRRFQDGRLSA